MLFLLPSTALDSKDIAGNVPEYLFAFTFRLSYFFPTSIGRWNKSLGGYVYPKEMEMTTTPI
jgi:hypothetical protein